MPEQVKLAIDNGLRLSKEEQILYQQALATKGWAGTNWPVEHGGTGWSATQKYIFYNESAKAKAPRIVPFGLSMVAPVIYSFGNKEQQERFFYLIFCQVRFGGVRAILSLMLAQIWQVLKLKQYVMVKIILLMA